MNKRIVKKASEKEFERFVEMARGGKRTTPRNCDFAPAKRAA